MKCRVCSEGVTPYIALMEVQEHPLCTQFLPSRDAPQRTFPLSLMVCDGCGTVQLRDAVPVDKLVPPYDWIRYNEPEGHLDDLADAIRALPGIGPDSTICGVSSKDDTLLARLARLGVGLTWRIDLPRDLGAEAPGAGLESIQDRLTPERAQKIARQHGAADVVVARHIFEHAYDLRRFARALAALAKPGGTIVIETPDCAASFAAGDCTVLWEEYVVYLTPGTLQGAVASCGLGTVAERVYPYPYENSLVIFTRAGAPVVTPSPEEIAVERTRTAAFRDRVAARRKRVSAWIAAQRAAGTRLALFGAGHLACTFLAMMDVAGEIECVIDDHPRKQGLFMPGSRLPIVPSSAMADRQIGIALMTLSPESEEAVVRRQAGFLEYGGRLLSIFPNSRLALDAHMTEVGTR